MIDELYIKIDYSKKAYIEYYQIIDHWEDFP
jgi:hypothetical protein